MKIKIENFGPIGEIEYDLEKDLHLIYGKNAIGKSYGAYFIYCFLKSIREINFQPNTYWGFQKIDEQTFGIARSVHRRIKKLDYNDKISINKEIEAYLIKQLTPELIPPLTNSLRNTFASLENLYNRYSNLYYTITITVLDKEIIIKSDSKGQPFVSSIKYFYFFEAIHKNTKHTEFTIQYLKRKRIGESNINKFIDRFKNLLHNEYYFLVFDLINNVNDIYFLPASRSGLYQALNAFTPIMAELTQNRFFMKSRSIDLPSLPEPLSDYFIDLSTLNKMNRNKKLNKVVKEIENDILFGEVDYDEESRKIIYSPHGIDLKLDLSEASSMVAELAPIVVFLRHIVNNKFVPDNTSLSHVRRSLFYNAKTASKSDRYRTVLFIEEPEAHLHPEVQVKLIEVFSKLSKMNIRIIITTHSNYMLNKINNLILSKTIESNLITAYHLVSSPIGCVVNKEMSVSQDGILDENFTSVTHNLYIERMNILEDNDQSN